MNTIYPPTQPLYSSRRSPVLAQNIVATSHPLAAQAGIQMIAKGGNAIDAAIASAITLTVVEPTGCGLGSDAFAVIWDGEKLNGLNASGKSPASWTSDRFSNLEKMPFRGWESVTVPGAVSSWITISEKFGLKVSIHHNSKGHGFLKINYANLDEIQSFLDKLK